MLPVTIADPAGAPSAEVRLGAVCVTAKPAPPTEAEAAQRKALTGLLSSSGSTDMTVDGSSTAVSFQVVAESGAAADILTVTSFRLVFHSTTLRLDNSESRRFGAATSANTPLSSGLTFTVRQNGTTTEMFLSPVKVLGDFYRYAGGAGVGINNAIVNDSDAISQGVDFLMVLVVPPSPVALYPGTLDSITLLVQDDLTALALFETQFYGFRQAP